MSTASDEEVVLQDPPAAVIRNARVMIVIRFLLHAATPLLRRGVLFRALIIGNLEFGCGFGV